MDNTFYCICGLFDEYHEVDGKGYAWGTQRFYGVEGKHRICVYDEVPTEKTLTFKTKEDAERYINEHNIRNGKGINVHQHFVVKVFEC